jgi:hypothetical protein
MLLNLFELLGGIVLIAEESMVIGENHARTHVLWNVPRDDTPERLEVPAARIQRTAWHCENTVRSYLPKLHHQGHVL